MKIYTGYPTGITKISKEQDFYQTNDLVNKITVYIDQLSVSGLVYSLSLEFLRADGRKTVLYLPDAFAEDEDTTLTEDGVTYDINNFTLTSAQLAAAGALQITCYISIYESGVVTKRGVVFNAAANVRKTVGYSADTIFVVEEDENDVPVIIADTKTAIETLQGSKVNVTDIVDNLTSTATNKPLSANQGKVLKDLVDNRYTKTESDSTFAPKSNAIKHSGSQLQDYIGNNVYPNLDDGQVVPPKTVFYSQTKNLFDTYKIVSGYGINSSGVPYANAEWSYINNYIDVGAYTKMAVSVYQNSSCTISLYCYASDHSYLSFVGYAVTKSTIDTLPNNTKYVLIAFKNTQLDVTTVPVQVELGDTVTSYVLPYSFNDTVIGNGAVKITSLEDTLKNSLSKVYQDVTVTWTNGQYCKRGDGSIQTDANQAYTSISVSSGEYYNISGIALGNITSYVLKNSLGIVLESGLFYNAWTSYDLVVYIQMDGTLYVNSGKYATEGYSTIKKVIGYKPVYANNDDLVFLDKNIKSRIIDEQLKNDFTWSTSHIPCATFTFDDALNDIDLIASVFEANNVPLCLAVIPSKLNNVCNGLTQTTGSFTVGMTVKQVCDKVVELGGEVLCHWASPLTSASTDTDYYNVYIGAKKQLEDAGYSVNGIITAGGTNYQTQDFAKDTEMARIYYQYADLTASHNSNIEQFYNRRNFLDSGVSDIEDLVDNFVAQTGTQPYSKWLNFASHGTNTTTIADITTMLQYVISKGITVTTWKNIYNTYKSSKLEERIKALE